MAYWIHLIHIQLGTLGLRELTKGVHKLDGFPHCVDAAAIEKRAVRRLSFLKSSDEESVWRLSPIWCCCYILAPGRAVKITGASGRRYRGITLTVDGLNWVWIVKLAKSRWTSHFYITLATGSSDQLERRCWNENQVPAEALPTGLRLSSPGERKRNAVIARRVGGGSICCSSVQSPTHLSHTILSIKWEVYIFLKNCVHSSSLCRHYASAYVLCGYTTPARKDGPGWIEQVILIGWKYASTLTVELINAPNKNTKFFPLQP